MIGGSNGIGKAIAKAFADEDSQVTLVARNESVLETVIEEIGGKKEGYSYFPANLLEKNAPTRTGKELFGKHRIIDIVVHNVGDEVDPKSRTVSLMN